MSDIYAQILEELPEGKRPKDHGGFILENNTANTEHPRYLWVNPKFNRDWLTVEVHDAHAHIRCAAEDFVREWCKSRDLVLWLVHGNVVPGISIGSERTSHEGEAYDQTLMGSGTDLPTALLAALKYIKEHP